MQIFLVLILSLIFLSGCAHTSSVTITTVPDTPEEILQAKEVWQKINDRRKTVESSPELINESYKELKIKDLSRLPVTRYEEYRKFVDNGVVYIINHPAYFTFFHHPKIKRDEKSMGEDMITLLLEEGDNANHNDSKTEKYYGRYKKNYLKAIKEFERIGHNFLEFKSMEKKLIILILPGNYKKYHNYSYKNGQNEFLRYINDATNMSESVLYLESKKPNRGQLPEEDLNTLVEFLKKIEATTIMLGGEYIGRCQEDLYRHLAATMEPATPIYIVPELSPPSPDDMSSDMKDLLDSDDKLSLEAATYNIFYNKYERLERIPKLKNLKSRLFYENPNEQSPDN